MECLAKLATPVILGRVPRFLFTEADGCAEPAEDKAFLDDGKDEEGKQAPFGVDLGTSLDGFALLTRNNRTRSSVAIASSREEWPVDPPPS